MSTSWKKESNIQQSTYEDRYGQDTIIYGKVTKVFSETDNPQLEGAINFSHNSKRALPTIAYPQNFANQNIPVLGEVVGLFYNEDLEKVFYSPPLNLHNNPTHNSTDEVVVSTPNYVEPSTVNPYTVFAGDTIFQGRFGQSIRFTQTQPYKNPWSIGEVADSNPVIVISNGQVNTQDGSSLLLEDPKRDASSLYLIQQSTIDLPDLGKRNSNKEAILPPEKYIGNQAVLVSDRLYLNAREDSILLSAQSGSIGLSSDTVNLDGITSIRLDAPSYNLQADTFTSTNQERTVDSQTSTYNFDQFNINGTNVTFDYTRIALGANATHGLIQSTELMADLATLAGNITNLSNALTGVVALLAALPGGQAPAAALQTAAATLSTQATTVQSKAASGAYLSTKAFTE